MTNVKTVHVIINPAAGKNEIILGHLNTVFRNHQVDWEVRITQEYGDGDRLAAEAIEAGVDLVVVYGGDGTVTDVLNAMVNTDTPLAILPGGTGNSTAMEFDLDEPLDELIAKMMNGHTIRVDVGQIGENYFLHRADLGNPAEVVTEASREEKDSHGEFAYTKKMVELTTKAEQATYRLTIDGRDIQAEGIGVLIGNSNELGLYNLTMHPDVDPTDGLLDVFIIEHAGESSLGMAGEYLNLIDGSLRFSQHYQGQEIHLESDPPQKVRIGDEYVNETPLDIRVIPHSVRLLVPKGEGD